MAFCFAKVDVEKEILPFDDFNLALTFAEKIPPDAQVVLLPKADLELCRKI